jgi:hypothetical protein
MRNKDTLKFISNNIKGCKTKIALLSISQILLGVLTVAFSFMLRFIIGAIEKGSKDEDEGEEGGGSSPPLTPTQLFNNPLYINSPN